MKILTVLLMNVAVCAWAQQIDYNSIILPTSAKDVDFSEVLVRLAWQNNPENKILKGRLGVAEAELKQAQWKWSEQLRVTGNLNEFNINPSEATQAGSQFFPRYNISAYISLSNFVVDPQVSKSKRYQKTIAEESINGQKLALRAEVLRRYQNYLMDQEMLRIQNENVTSVQSIYNIAEQKFGRGEISFEEFNTTSDRNNAEKMKLINYQSNLSISKINLEELIGVRLENVLK